MAKELSALSLRAKRSNIFESPELSYIVGAKKLSLKIVFRSGKSPPVSAGVKKIEDDYNDTNNDQCMNNRCGKMECKKSKKPKDNKD
jgi:hypothetical protein